MQIWCVQFRSNTAQNVYAILFIERIYLWLVRCIVDFLWKRIAGNRLFPFFQKKFLWLIFPFFSFLLLHFSLLVILNLVLYFYYNAACFKMRSKTFASSTLFKWNSVNLELKYLMLLWLSWIWLTQILRRPYLISIYYGIQNLHALNFLGKLYSVFPEIFLLIECADFSSLFFE